MMARSSSVRSPVDRVTVLAVPLWISHACTEGFFSAIAVRSPGMRTLSPHSSFSPTPRYIRKGTMPQLMRLER